MLKYNGKEFRNLEEQVGYLTAAFNSGKLIDELGIKVLGVFPDLNTAKEAIRPPYEYGDAFEIGTTKPYNLYIYTRDIEDFFDFGPFPTPGPQGKTGITPAIEIKADITDTTGIPEVTVTKTGTDESPIFNFTFKNIKGERGQTGMQGAQGIKGNTGATGPIGPQGNKGDKGDTGPAFKLLGNLTSTSQLPTPTAELQSQGAAYTIPNTEGIKHIWVIQGTDNLLWTDIGISGVQGPKGEDGIGINDLQSVQDIGAPSVTYNTTNGITINNTERYTYSTGQTDVNTEREIPLIASEGISIDANEGSDKILIKSLSSNLKNGTGVKSIEQVINNGTTTIPISTKNPNAITLGAPEIVNIGAVGESTSAFGGASNATGKRSHAEGTNTVAIGKYSHAEGDNSVALGNDSHAEGNTTVSKGQASHAEGHTTQAKGVSSHAEGIKTVTEGNYAHSEGNETMAHGNASHSEGTLSAANGENSHAEGRSTSANGTNSHSEGYETITSGIASHAEGI